MRKLTDLFTPSAQKKDQEVASGFKVFMPGVILGLVIFIAVGSIILVLVLRRQGRDLFSPNQMQVYFFNPAEGQLYPEGRPWPYGNQNDWVRAAIGHLRFPPSSRHLTSTWPAINPLLGEEETPFLRDIGMYGSTVIAEFYESYLEMPPLQEALFRSALTLTMVNLPFIDEVKIRVNDMEWVETAETIANRPAISSVRLGNTTLVLYFIDESGEGLVREYYTAVGVDLQRRASVALERLIEGSTIDGAFSAIPPETRVLAVIPMLDETFSVYVNLSGEFITRFSGGPAQARLMVAAIVNTVLENIPQARRVFFLIDSSREEHIPGVADFSGVFEYDETVMVGFVPEEDEE